MHFVTASEALPAERQGFYFFLSPSYNSGVSQCYRCGKELADAGAVKRESYCPSCNAALHCCRNCRFHVPSAHNQCSEPSAEWVRDKEKPNFCEYFTFREGSVTRSSPDRDAAREAFDNFFKKL